MPPRSDAELDYEVTAILNFHRGKENPIPRWELVRRIFGAEAVEPQTDKNPCDRRIRDAKERLRAKLLICDMGDGNGCYLATTWEEFIEFRWRYLKPALPVLKADRAMMDTAKDRFPREYAEWKRSQEQPNLFEVGDLGNLPLMNIR